MKAAFIHPDLGIGGAERLVVDAAAGLKASGDQVTIYTSHFDESHCFDEVKNGNIKVKCYGDFLPTRVLGRFAIFCAIIRQLFLVLKMVFTGEVKEYDVFIVDQLSFCLPIVHFFKSQEAKTLFYCHFPDQLLAQRQNRLKEVYRKPFDLLEEFTTGCADQVVVNSSFTKSVFRSTFKTLSHFDPAVIYPCVDTSESVSSESLREVESFFAGGKFFLSVNRFERKKNIELALRAFIEFAQSDKECRLVIAGGFDPRVKENVEHLIELETLAQSNGLVPMTIRGKLVALPRSCRVLFLPSISGKLKDALISKAEMLLYTPSYEHFGIVPVEAMKLGTAVLAVNNGGPLETIVDFEKDEQNATGFLLDKDPHKWCECMIKFQSVSSRDTISSNGIKRACEIFSRDSMTVSFKDTISHIKVKHFGYENHVVRYFVKHGVVWVVLIAIYIATRYGTNK